MKNTLIKCALLLILPAQLLRAETAGPAAPQIAVSVDPRVELFSIIFRLAGNREYNSARVPGYVRDVDAQFLPFKDHPAVKYAAALRGSNIGYDAPMNLAVHLKDAQGLEQRVPFASRPGGLCPRWKPEEAEKMAELARDFAKASDFKGFYARHQTLYNTAVRRMQSLLESEMHMEWFGAFFGSGKRADFRMVLGMLNGGNCYGPHFTNADGSEEVYSVLGVWKADGDGQPVFTSDMVPTIVHEFTHSYANPVIDRHAGALLWSGSAIYKEVAEIMGRQAYSDWKIMMYESLVRACVHRYLQDNEGRAARRKEAAEDERIGFYWVEGLTDLLGKYEAQPRKYKDLDEFFPQIAAYYKGYAATVAASVKAINDKAAAEQASREKAMLDWRDRGPRIVAMSPANNAAGVDPATDKLVITFDRPMRDGWSFVQIDPARYPESLGSPAYDSHRKVLTVQIKLVPGRSYAVSLNNADYTGFKSADGIPLYPVVYKFSTK